METIQVNVSTRLARRLKPHSEELARILELGLRQIEETARAEPDTKDLAAQKQVVAALQQAGAVGPTPEVTAQYLAKRRARSWKPIATGGQPASQMIVEEKGAYGGVEP